MTDLENEAKELESNWDYLSDEDAASEIERLNALVEFE